MRLDRLGAYWALLDVAHDFADHVVQTDHQAAGKAAERGWAGPMAGHVGGYQATQAAFLAAYWAVTGRRPAWWRVAAAAAVSAGTHAFLDRRTPVLRALEWTGSRSFAASRVRAERALKVLPNVEAGPDGWTNTQEAGKALGHAVRAARLDAHDPAGQALAHAVAHAVEVVDPERPFQLHGPYLADQALHRACLLVCAAILAGGER